MNKEIVPYLNHPVVSQNYRGQQQFLPQTPYVVVPNPYYQQQFVRPFSTQLGDLSNEEAQKILLEHFESLPLTVKTTILTEAISGKFDTMSKEVAKAMEKVCTTGAFEKVKATVIDNKLIFYIILSFLLGFVIYSFSTKKTKGKK